MMNQLSPQKYAIVFVPLHIKYTRRGLRRSLTCQLALDCFCLQSTHTHTHTNTYIYMHIRVYIHCCTDIFWGILGICTYVCVVYLNVVCLMKVVVVVLVAVFSR